MKPEEALAIYQAGPETVVRVLLEIDARLNASQQRVRLLEGSLAKDSHNSSKPPSSDGLKKTKPKPGQRANHRWPAGTFGPDLAHGGQSRCRGVAPGQSVRVLRDLVE